MNHMTDREIQDQLGAAFSETEVKSRPGRGSRTFRYVDARTVAQRLDDVLGISGWSFTTTVADAQRNVVHGRLVITMASGQVAREDYGYPNTPDSDEEPLKSAASDALKRAAAQLGVGRYLYGGSAPEQRDTPARRFEMAGKFGHVLQAIRALDAAKADEIVAKMRANGTDSLVDLPAPVGAKAIARALEILDQITAEPDASAEAEAVR